MLVMDNVSCQPLKCIASSYAQVVMFGVALPFITLYTLYVHVHIYVMYMFNMDG